MTALYSLVDFIFFLQKCFQLSDNVWCAGSRSVATRSMSHLEVKGKKGSSFCVRALTLSFFGGFHNYMQEMFATIRRSVTRNIQIRRSKVNAGAFVLVTNFLFL